MIGNKNSHIGFTLIELVVAVAVFSSMITIISSIFINSVSSQRKNIGQQDVLDNARYILENMGRSIRQSVIISSDGSGSSLTIEHPTEKRITYYLQNNQIIEMVEENPIALSSNNVYVSRLNFEVSGNDIDDKTQPRVTISLSLRNVSSKSNEQSYINLQTTITPRILQYGK
jgi:prepilin-type N-terminal cleavage/methylation domain-containing protein